MHDVLNQAEMVSDELVQRWESGYDVADLEGFVRSAVESGSPEEMDRAYRRLEETSLRTDWPHEEPSALDVIRRSLPSPAEVPTFGLDDAGLRDRVLGAWLGRCAGCNLGKPVEGWSRERIRRYLDLADAYPITDYLPVLDPFPEGLQLNWCWPETTRGNIEFMARDDDIDYTILGMHILEQHGFGFGPDDVAEEWLLRLPFFQVYTAERAAYRNLIHGIRPPETASHRNPYREWIGAQIRADMWGYVFPGEPGNAALLAFADASLSHTQNGIYGEMWAAALIAACFVAADARSAIDISLDYVPPRSRLAEAIRDVRDLHAKGLDWEAARDEVEVRYGHYSFVHTVNNAALVTAALLWGDGDFTRTIGLAVQGGWDTDCTGATAGSIFGALHGAGALPAHWVDPLNDRARSAIMGYDHSTLSDLADRTLRLANARHEDGRV
ncbi:MAG: ADP-ribosylglycohydrolase family protein [Actinomycetota bacterium]